MIHTDLSPDPDAVAWPATTDGDTARRWLTAMLRDGTDAFIANADVEMRVLTVGPDPTGGAEPALMQAGGVALPITLSRPDRDLAYPASPVQHYFAYSAEEAKKVSRAADWAARATLVPAAALLRRTAFDRTVMVNNYLLSTNLWPGMTAAQVGAAVGALRAAFPDRALAFKSLDPVSTPAVLDACRDIGAVLLPSRVVWTLDPADGDLDRIKNVRRDARRLAETPYTVRRGEDLSDAEIGRVGELYRMLYLGKYVRLNPDLTDLFLVHAVRERLLTVRAFERDGRIDAALGYFVRNGVMTQPVFGYDTGLPPALGLYRLLAAQVLVEARAVGARILNRSAGAGRFKKLRGGRPQTEVHAVFCDHLPRQQRMVWHGLRAFADGVAFPLIRRLEL